LSKSFGSLTESGLTPGLPLKNQEADLRTVWWSISGAILFVILITWMGPTLISWWFTPPVDTLFNCKGPIEWSLKRFQWAQMAALALGALLGLAGSFAFKGPKRTSAPL